MTHPAVFGKKLKKKRKKERKPYEAVRLSQTTNIYA